MVLIPLRKQTEAPRPAAFGPSDSRRPHFGSGNNARIGILGHLARDDSGVAAIEYALLASLIAIAIITGAENLGDKVGKAWDDIAQAVGASGGSGNAGGNGNGVGGGNGNADGNGNGNAGGNGNGNAGGNGNGNAGGNGNGNAGGNGNGNAGGNGNGNGNGGP